MVVQGEFDCVVKLVDLGEACNREAKIIRTNIGTEYFLAPECDGKTYTPKSDVYSLGVMFWYLIDGMLPWKSKSCYRDPQQSGREEKRTESHESTVKFI